MKKYKLLIISVIVMILSFLNSWYSDQLFNILFVLYLIPVLILFISWVTCLILSIKKIIKERNIISFATFGIVILTALLIIFFPFREAKVKLELYIYEDDRLEIIKMIDDNELKVDEYGNVALPLKYWKTSSSGEVHVYQNDVNGKVIGFWVFRGIQSGSRELIYSTGGEKLIRDNEGGHPIVSIEKLKENWYYVDTDY